MENATWSGRTSACKGRYEVITGQGSVIFESIQEMLSDEAEEVGLIARALIIVDVRKTRVVKFFYDNGLLKD